jgi:hypothetical protein
MRVLKAIKQGIDSVDKLIKSSPILRVSLGVLFGVFMTYLFTTILLSVYLILRKTEDTFGSGSMTFIVCFWLLGFFIAIQPILESIFDTFDRRKKAAASQVSTDELRQ